MYNNCCRFLNTGPLDHSRRSSILSPVSYSQHERSEECNVLDAIICSLSPFGKWHCRDWKRLSWTGCSFCLTLRKNKVVFWQTVISTGKEAVSTCKNLLVAGFLLFTSRSVSYSHYEVCSLLASSESVLWFMTASIEIRLLINRL